jgi:beta-glucosidase
MRSTGLLLAASLLTCPLICQTSLPPLDEHAAYRQAGLPIEERVADLIGRMSLEEKARQLDMYAGVPDLVDRSTDKTHAAPDAIFRQDQAAAVWGNLGVGSVHDLYPSATLANSIQQWVIAHSRLGIPALFIEEGLHGYSDGTVFPAPINLAATWDPGLAKQTGAAIASETRAAGVDMILAPVLDLAREPRWGRVEEDFGEDLYLTGQLGLAYVRGVQGDSLDSDHTVVAEPKHFAGHGSPESGLNTSPVHMGERELRTVMLKAFEPAIREGHAMGAMAAYHEIDGVPVVADPFLFNQILRRDWGFKGFVLSDLGAIRRLWEDHQVAAGPREAIVQALEAGVDMQFYDFDHATFQQAIVSSVKDRTLSMDALDRAVSSVLRVKFALGLFDHPMTDVSLTGQVKRSKEHLKVSLESARESMTLLKNDNRLLPLPATVRRIAVIGPNGNVARYGDYEDESHGERISIVDGLRRLLPGAQVDFDDGKNLTAAVAMAQGAEVAILALGEWQGISGEGFDRQSLDLPGNEEALLEAVAATGKPVVMVLQNGRPLTIPWAAEHIPAILEAWYPGEFGGQAIAETLLGINNPGGKLTITFPRSIGQLPDFYNFDPSKSSKYVEGDRKPLFPFGHGLSYTTFRFDNLTVTPTTAGAKQDVIVTVNVTNTGATEGDEVAQLYLHHDVSSVEVADRQLTGFERIPLKPGESQVVTFRLTAENLAVWNRDHNWVTEPGSYTLYAGDSSEATLTAKFEIVKPAKDLKAETALPDRWISAPLLQVKGNPVTDFSAAYQLAVRVLEFNLRHGLMEAGEGYGTWTRDTAINSWNATSLLLPDVAQRSLWRETEETSDGPVVSGQYWDKVIWIIAANHHALLTGDTAFAREAYAASVRTLAEMRQRQLNQVDGLFRGPAVYGDGVASYPDPPFDDLRGDNIRDYAEARQLEVLSTNSVYFGAYRAAASLGKQAGQPESEIAALEHQADELRANIQRLLWLPQEHRFSYFRDGQGRTDATQEALGESFAVLLGVANPAESQALFRNAIETPWGVACTWPPYTRYRDATSTTFGRHNGTIWPFINAFWATAAASTGETQIFASELRHVTDLALRSGDFREIYHPITGLAYGGVQSDRTWDSVRHQTWSASGYLNMVYSGLFGMSFEQEGIRLKPVVPSQLGVRGLVLNDLSYRQANLTIAIHGSGSSIRRFWLDGRMQPDAFIPGTLSGTHRVDVFLDAAEPRSNRTAVEVQGRRPTESTTR